MLRQIEPERILCYSDPFSEMEGNIVFIDYNLSSWKYQNDDPQAAPRPDGSEFSPIADEPAPSKFFRFFTGEEPLPPDSGILVKRGYIESAEEAMPRPEKCGIIRKTGFVPDSRFEKGGGSAYGGDFSTEIAAAGASGIDLPPDSEETYDEEEDDKENQETKGDDVVFGSDTKSEQKLNSQMEKRGWTEESVRSIVDNAYTTRTSTNKATGNDATVYYTQRGSYVIIDDITKVVVQISDNNNPATWVPDSNIIDPYFPNK